MHDCDRNYGIFTSIFHEACIYGGVHDHASLTETLSLYVVFVPFLVLDLSSSYPRYL